MEEAWIPPRHFPDLFDSQAVTKGSAELFLCTMPLGAGVWLSILLPRAKAAARAVWEPPAKTG